MKKWIFIGIALAVAGIFYAGYQVPDQLLITRNNAIAMAPQVVMRVFVDKRHIKGWWPGVIDQSTADENLLYRSYWFRFTTINDNNIKVLVTDRKDSLTGNIRIAKMASDTSILNWRCRISTPGRPLENIFYFWKAQKMSRAFDGILEEVKKYTEKPTHIYGYTIQMEKIDFSNVIVSTMAVQNADVYETLKKNLDSIKNYIHENDLGLKGNFMVKITPTPTGSLQVMTGIPVNKYRQATGNFINLQMPVGGSLATVLFEGMYKDRAKVYSALEEYARDKELSNVSLPYEIIKDNRLPVSDSSLVSLKICYPVF